MLLLCFSLLLNAITEDLGFQHLLFVYSGRRGVHCWIADERARKLSNEARGSVADYINVFTVCDYVTL